MKKNDFLTSKKQELFNFAWFLNLIALIVFLSLSSSILGQTTVFTDNFPTSYSSITVNTAFSATEGTPPITWRTNTTSAYTSTPPVFSTQATGSDYSLAIQNYATGQALNKGWVTGTLSSIAAPTQTTSPLNTTLNSSTGVITWTFNMRTSRTTKFSSSNTTGYFSAVVLAATAQDFTNTTSGGTSGYAVIEYGGTTNNLFKLVRFTGGINGTFTQIGTASAENGDMRNWASIKVVYNPKDNSWSFYVRDEPTSYSNAATDPTSGVIPALSTSSTESSGSLTATAMTNFGFYYNIGSTSTGSSNRAYYDNFKIASGAPSWSNNYPKADVPTNTGFTVRAATSVPGNVYYVVLASGAAAPTSAQVKLGQDGGGSPLAANLKGIITVTGGAETTATVSGLSAPLTYDVYFVAEDSYTTPAIQATPQKVTISTILAPPSSQPTNLLFSNVGTTGMQINFTASAGGADNYIVLRNAGSAPTGTPVNNITYTVGQMNIGSGTNTVAYVGPLTSFTETSLIGSTTYYYSVYAYNSSSNPSYLTTSPLSSSQVTDIGVKGVTAATTTGFTANWLPVSNADNYDIKIYDSNNFQVGSTLNTGAATGALAFQVVPQSLTDGATYTFTVTGKIGSTPIKESPKSAFFTITAGKTLSQYTSLDATALKTDLSAGSTASDIVELLTSGGNYTLALSATTGISLTKGLVLRAVNGLASKPIISYTNSVSGSTNSVFYTTSAGLTVDFEGIEFNGNNAVNTQNELFYASGTSAWCNVIVKNCFIHDWLNTGGAFRFDAPCDATVTNKTNFDMENCLVNNCGGRFICFYTPSDMTVQNPNYYGNVILLNNTFSNFTITSLSNPNAIVYYRTSTPYKAYGTTLTMSHCTIYNFNSAVPLIQLQGMSGNVTVNDNIIDNQGYPSNVCSYIWSTASGNGSVPVFDSNYAVGLQGVTPSSPTIVTNPISGATPSYTNATLFNFLLNSKTNLIATDGYVVGNTFGASFTHLTAPATINDASSVNATGFYASWSSEVTNATGYVVNVYNGATLASSTRVSGAGTTNATITGLAQNTTFTYKVIAIGDATNWSSSLESAASNSFSTLTLPTVTTQAVTSITSSSAIGNGNITVLGVPNPTQYGICWKTSAGATISDNVSTNGAASSTGAFTSLMTGLSGNTTYYVNAYATSSAGTVYGTEVSFTTAAPTAATDYFRSKTSANWSDNSSWESSIDNTSWIPATSTPTSSATGITILNGHTITLTAGTSTNALTVSLGAILKTGANTFTNSGTATINGSFQIDEGGWATGNNFVYGSAGTLIFNNATGPYAISGTPTYWPLTSGPANVTVQNTGKIEMQVPRTVTGIFQAATGVRNTFGNDLTVSGTVRLNSGGYFDNFSPTYSGSGTLEYNTTGNYGTYNEWGSGSSIGYGVPQNVSILNSTAVSLSGSRTIPGTLAFTSGTLTLGANNLTVSTAITGASATNYVVTNGSGTLTMPVAAAATVVIPVGASASSYDPVSVTPVLSTNFSAKVSSSISGTAASGYTYNAKEWNMNSDTPSSTALILTPSAVTASGVNSIIGVYDGTNYVNVPATLSTGAYSATFTSFPLVAVSGATDLPTGISSTKLVGVTFDGQTIQNNANLNLQVYDVTGRRVASSNKNINMNSNPNGIYIIKGNAGIFKINLNNK